MQLDVEQRREQRSTMLGLRQSAWLEMLILYGLLLLVDLFFFDFSRYWGWNPHPFWLVTLLLACQYGTKEGLVAGLIGCLIYLIGDWPPQTFEQSVFEYLFSIFIHPILWLVTAVLFGELRQRHIRERGVLEDEILEARDRESRITRAYEQVKEIKSGLELRTATQIRSSLAAHHALRSMDVLNQREALTGIERLIHSVMNVHKFSVYLMNNNGMDARVTSGWTEEDHFARQIDKDNPIYRAMLEQHRAVTLLNADDERILHGHGMMAVPMIDPSSRTVFGMVKVESMPFTDLNFHSVETLLAIGELGGTQFNNLQKYETVQSESMVNPEYGTHSYGYFHRYADFMSALGRRLGFDVSMLVVKLVGADDMPYTTRVQASKLFAETVQETLRKVDMTFDYQQNTEEFSIVLPATNQEGAEIVREKIQGKLSKALRTIDPNLKFSFTVEQLHA